MKKASKIFSIFILCSVLVGCSTDNNAVSLRVKEGSLTKTKATLIIENNTNREYIYGEPFIIEKETNGKWTELSPINEFAFNLPAYGLQAKTSIEIEIGWEYGYGKLNPGKYRIIKDVFLNSDSAIEEKDLIHIAAEFIIK